MPRRLPPARAAVAARRRRRISLSALPPCAGAFRRVHRYRLSPDRGAGKDVRIARPNSTHSTITSSSGRIYGHAPRRLDFASPSAECETTMTVHAPKLLTPEEFASLLE